MGIRTPDLLDAICQSAIPPDHSRFRNTVPDLLSLGPSFWFIPPKIGLPLPLSCTQAAILDQLRPRLELAGGIDLGTALELGHHLGARACVEVHGLTGEPERRSSGNSEPLLHLGRLQPLFTREPVDQFYEDATKRVGRRCLCQRFCLGRREERSNIGHESPSG